MKKNITAIEKIERKVAIEKTAYDFLMSLNGIHEESIEFQWIRKNDDNISGVEITATFMIFEKTYTVDVRPNGITIVKENDIELGKFYWSAYSANHITEYSAKLDEYQQYILREIGNAFASKSNNRIGIRIESDYTIDGLNITWNGTNGIKMLKTTIVWRNAFGNLMCEKTVPESVLEFVKKNFLCKGC